MSSLTLVRVKEKERNSKQEELSEKELNLERLKDLTELSAQEQKEEFQMRFIFRLEEEGYRKVAELSDAFLDMCDSTATGSTAIAYSNVQFQKFLKSNGVYITDEERMEVYKLLLEIILDNTEISLVQFLMLYYRNLILEEYEKRWENISDDALREKKQGKKPKEKSKEDEEEDLDEDDDDDVEELTDGDKIIEEMFQPPLGVDKDLDEAIVKFSEMISKREQKIADFIEIIQNSGRVRSSRAKTELQQFKAKAQDQINKSKIYFSAAIKHVKENQEKKFMEIRDKIEKDEEQKLTRSKSSLELLP